MGLATQDNYVEMGGNIDSSGSSLLLTAISVMKTIVGAGILTLSWSFAYGTMWPGTLCTVVLGVFSAHSFWMLGRCSEITGKRSYGGIWTQAFGERWAWIPSLVTLVFCAFALVSYLIIIGDYLPLSLRGLGSPYIPDRRVAIAFVSLLILPLNFLKDLTPLGYTSILGTIGSLYTTGVLVNESVTYTGPPSDRESWRLSPGLFVTAPTVAFAFMAHFNAPALYQQMANRSPSRWFVVTVVAFSVCGVITCICGSTGYYMFGNDLLLPGRSNVFAAPSLEDKPDVMVAYLATTLSVALGTPFLMESFRGPLGELLVSCGLDCGGSDMRHNLLSWFCVTTTLLASMCLKDLGITNAINGAVCGCLIMFVFPSLMYLKCIEGTSDSKSFLHRGLPMISIGVGLFIGFAGVTSSVLLAFDVPIE